MRVLLVVEAYVADAVAALEQPERMVAHGAEKEGGALLVAGNVGCFVGDLHHEDGVAVGVDLIQRLGRAVQLVAEDDVERLGAAQAFPGGEFLCGVGPGVWAGCHEAACGARRASAMADRADQAAVRIQLPATRERMSRSSKPAMSRR